MHFGESCAVNVQFITKKPFLVGKPPQTTSYWRADHKILIHDDEAGVNYQELLSFNPVYFQFCNKTFMICSTEYNCTENEKTELISYFFFPTERFTKAGSSILPCFFSLRTRISRRQLVPKRQNWEN